MTQLQKLRHLKITFQDLALYSNEVKMYLFKKTFGLKEWATKSSPTSPQFPLQINTQKDGRCN